MARARLGLVVLPNYKCERFTRSMVQKRELLSQSGYIFRPFFSGLQIVMCRSPRPNHADIPHVYNCHVQAASFNAKCLLYEYGQYVSTPPLSHQETMFF